MVYYTKNTAYRMNREKSRLVSIPRLFLVRRIRYSYTMLERLFFIGSSNWFIVKRENASSRRKPFIRCFTNVSIDRFICLHKISHMHANTLEAYGFHLSKRIHQLLVLRNQDVYSLDVWI